MEKPKLIFLVTEDWYLVSHRLPLASAAAESGYDVVAATRVRAHGDVINKAGVRVVPVELSRRGGNPIREISALVKLYKSENPAIVHHVALKPVLYGTIAAILAGVPRVVNAVAGLGWLFTTDRLHIKLVRSFAQKILAGLLAASRCRTIVQNSDDRRLLVDAGVPDKQIYLVRGAGVDTTKFFPVPNQDAVIKVVLVARMLWDKGVKEFVEAAKLINVGGEVARFILVGTPDKDNPASVPEDEIAGWHGTYGIECWGHRDDIQAVLHQAHIACLPSYREGLPKSLLEAAACGLPIVTTDTTGCREVVDHGYNGLLVPVKNHVALADALGQLVRDKNLRLQMGQRSRERALAEFAQERIIHETLDVYKQLMAEIP